MARVSEGSTFYAITNRAGGVFESQIYPTRQMAAARFAQVVRGFPSNPQAEAFVNEHDIVPLHVATAETEKPA